MSVLESCGWLLVDSYMISEVLLRFLRCHGVLGGCQGVAGGCNGVTMWSPSTTKLAKRSFCDNILMIMGFSQ